MIGQDEFDDDSMPDGVLWPMPSDDTLSGWAKMADAVLSSDDLSWMTREDTKELARIINRLVKICREKDLREDWTHVVKQKVPRELKIYFEQNTPWANPDSAPFVQRTCVAT